MHRFRLFFHLIKATRTKNRSFLNHLRNLKNNLGTRAIGGVCPIKNRSVWTSFLDFNRVPNSLS